MTPGGTATSSRICARSSQASRGSRPGTAATATSTLARPRSGKRSTPPAPRSRSRKDPIRRPGAPTRPRSASASRVSSPTRCAGRIARRSSRSWSSARIASLRAMGRKKYLFTPGPTPVPPQVLAALAEPVVHHRSPDFRPIYERCLARLREVCRTEHDALLFTASGTGAFESAAAHLVSPGEPHLVVSAGNFGERWASLTSGYGADVDHLQYAWGETPDADDVRARLRQRQAKAVWVVHSETSTGVVCD